MDKLTSNNRKRCKIDEIKKAAFEVDIKNSFFLFSVYDYSNFALNFLALVLMETLAVPVYEAY